MELRQRAVDKAAQLFYSLYLHVILTGQDFIAPGLFLKYIFSLYIRLRPLAAGKLRTNKTPAC